MTTELFQSGRVLDGYTEQLRSVARRLTYNDDTAQAQAKFLLLEAASKLDMMDTRIRHKSHGRLVVTNGLGKARELTFKEQVLYRVFKVKPECV